MRKAEMARECSDREGRGKGLARGERAWNARSGRSSRWGRGARNRGGRGLRDEVRVSGGGTGHYDAAMTTEARVVLVTAPDVDVARKIARAWVEARWVACVNCVPGI